MNASIRKGGNQYRDSFHQYGIHPQSGHNLRDGMNYPSVNLPLGVPPATAVVAAPSAANAPSQTSHYVQGTPLQSSAVASGTAVNIHGLTSHGGIATSTQAVLPLPNQHSQGPTPASTPPAAPNDPKTSSHYPPQTSFQSPMNTYNPLGRMYYQPTVGGPRGSPQTQSARTMNHIASGRQPQFVYYQNMQVGLMPQISMTSSQLTQNNTVAPLVTPFQGEPYQSFYNSMQQQNPSSSQNYAMPASYTMRPHSGNNIRSTNQAPVYSSTNVPAPTMMYNHAIGPLAFHPPQQQQPQQHQQQQPQQPQQQQQQQPAPKASAKDRKHRLKIVHPDTLEEVKLWDLESNNKATEKVEDTEATANHVRTTFATEVGKLALEASTTSSSSSATSSASPYAKKESSPATAPVNGEKSTSSSTSSLASSAYTASSKSDVKSAVSSSSTAPTSGLQNANDNGSNTVSEPLVNSFKSSNATANVSQSKQPMDYKRPTREEPSSAATTISGVSESVATITAAAKPSPTPSWPVDKVATAPAVSAPASVTSAKSASGAAPTSAAVAAGKKIPKDGENASSPGSSQTSLPVGATPSLTPSSDGLKAPSVTSTSVVLDDSNDTASKKATKQGIQSGPATEDDADKSAPPSGAKYSATSSQPLPTASQATTVQTSSAPVPAQSKADIKATSSSAGKATGALPTSGSSNEKPSPIATSPAPFGQPFSSKTPAVSTSAAADKTAAAPLAPSKDDKANPSAKTKSRAKENTEPNVENAKKPGSQGGPAKHSDAKPAGNAAASVTSKQTNGDAADAQGITEGKSKKNRKSSKKEINKKGSEKEGSDMDVFTEKPSSPPEKSRNNDKAQAQNNTANRSSKTNSSQKAVDDKEDISAGEPKKELVNSQNIPSTPAVSVADSFKTEPTVVETRPRKYTLEFLFSLRDLPQCKKSVKISPNLVGQLYCDVANGFANTIRNQNAYNVMSSNNMFMPPFANTSRGSMSLPTRKSQQGRLKNERQTPIHVTLSLKEDVPLRVSKDAWKPARFNADVSSMSADERRTQELYKSVTGILNKLTPEKFEPLVEKIKSLPIDSVGRLQGVIDLIFDKAIDEPGFCKWYAEMCNVMQHINIPDREGGKPWSFRTVLINKCQQQFERDKAEELDVIKKQEEIDACTDPEKKKELQLLFEETERKVRRKSVGNCRFIGELFKLQMLTPKIMLRCITKLLGSTDEESLECLCKLLTTIGKDLESKLNTVTKKEFDGYFGRMQDLSESKKHKVSSRIRFMLQDVIDLRKNEWVPRREADNPKKIEQINTELERKEQEIKMMNLQPPTRRNDDYNYRNREFNKKGTRTGSQNDNEWTTVSKNYKTNYKVDLNKFNALSNTNQQQISDSLGPTGGFTKWSSGVSANKMNDKKTVSNTFNSSFSMDNKPQLSGSNSFRSSLSNRVTPSSSMEKPKPYMNRDANEAGKISRSGSAQNILPPSRESSVPRQPPSRNASQTARQPTQPMLSDDEIQRASVTIYQEYDSNNDLKDSMEAFEERFNPKQYADAVIKIVSYIIENKPKSAEKCGVLLANLIKRGTVTKEHFVDALKFFNDLADDLIIDCPNMWITLAEVTDPLVAEDCLKINEIQTELAGKPLLSLIKSAVNKDSILTKYLLDLLDSTKENSDEVVKWIDANFENSRNSPELVFKLTTIICKIIREEWKREGVERADDSTVVEDVMKKYVKFFKIYIENKGELEMKCLLAVHEYIQRESYPRGFLTRIFELLYDHGLVSYDSYIQWKSSPNIPGLGVAVTSLFSFFAYIEEQNEQ